MKQQIAFLLLTVLLYSTVQADLICKGETNDIILGYALGQQRDNTNTDTVCFNSAL
jgi:hypothetical protein